MYEAQTLYKGSWKNLFYKLVGENKIAEYK